MAHETIEMTEVIAIVDELSSPTNEEFMQALRAYSDTGVSLAATKLAMEAGAGLTEGEVEALIDAVPPVLEDPVSTGHLLYVSPNGSNAKDGSSPRDAKQTIAAAYAALPAQSGSNPGGGVIVLSGEQHSVSAPIALDGTKPAAFVSYGFPGLVARYGSPSSRPSHDPIIKSSAGTLSSLFERIKGAQSICQVGFQFRGLVFDLADDTPYGIYLEAVNNWIVHDCFGMGPLANPTEEQALLRARAQTGGDCSWGRMSLNVCRNVGLADLGFSTSENCNANILSDNLVLPGASHGIKIKGGDRHTTRDNNIEAVAAGMYAIYLIQCNRHDEYGAHGEGGGTTYLKAEASGNCNLNPRGFHNPQAGDLLIDDDSGGNHYPSVPNVGTDYSGAAFKRVAIGAGSGLPPSGFMGRKLLYPSVAHVPIPLPQGSQMLGRVSRNILPSANVAAEFWDGDSWEVWAPTNLAAIVWENSDGFTVDATHQRFRIRTGNVGRAAGDWPILDFRFLASAAANRSYTVSVDRLDDSASLLEAGVPRTIALVNSGDQGLIFPLPHLTNSRQYRVEFDFTTYFANGGASFGFRYFGVLLDSVLSGQASGATPWIYMGSGSPEGVCTAAIGSLWFRTDAGDWYLKTSGTGNTNWQSLRVFVYGGSLAHTGTTVGFYSTAAVTKATAYTQTYSTADKTLSAYTSDPESGAYTGAADSEAKLADLNALRVAYENLRVFTEDLAAFTNSICDDLQRVGLVG